MPITPAREGIEEIRTSVREYGEGVRELREEVQETLEIANDILEMGNQYLRNMGIEPAKTETNQSTARDTADPDSDH